MRSLLCLGAALAALALAACGGDDDEPVAPAGATGTTGAEGVESGAGLGAGDFLDESIPDQAQAVEDLVGSDPACEGVDTKPGSDFQVAVAIDAAQAPPDTPLSEIVSGQCSEN